jgi:hypothetical protein
VVSIFGLSGSYRDTIKAYTFTFWDWIGLAFATRILGFCISEVGMDLGCCWVRGGAAYLLGFVLINIFGKFYLVSVQLKN